MSRSRGFILVTVLWTLALVAALVMATSTSFRGFAGVAAVGQDKVKAEALLTAGLEVAAGLIASPGRISSGELEATVTLSTGTVRIRLGDEGGRIDIGRAPAELLAALFRAVGAPTAAADEVARRVAEWRDARADTRAGGAPPSQLPRRVFTDVRQLASVPGVPPEWAAAAAPVATVFGGDTVNPLTAPPEILAALRGMDAAGLRAFLDARRSDPADVDRLMTFLGPARRYVEARPPQVVSVGLSARLAGGLTASAEAKITALAGDAKPYRVLAWNPLAPSWESWP